MNHHQDLDALKTKIKEFPRSPGVYIMKNQAGEIIYIGKARILPERLQSYFQKLEKLPPKNQHLVRHIHSIEYITTANEIEALILEANLIKQHHPRYNIELKDDKRYPYLKISREDFPRITVTRRLQKDGSRYFGPYTEVKELRQLLKLLRSLFQYRDCKLELRQGGKTYKPCINYQIHRCSGPCAGLIGTAEYQETMEWISKFLLGRTHQIEKMIQIRMSESAHQERFEQAARYRDLLNGIRKFSQKQAVSTEQEIDIDLIGIAVSGNAACTTVFQIRQGKLIGKKHFYFDNLDLFENNLAIESFIKQYYMNQEFIPEWIGTDLELEDKLLLQEWLSEKSRHQVRIEPVRQGHQASLMELVHQNAGFYLDEYLRQKSQLSGKINYMVEALQKGLHLPKPPIRIEAFDISHLSGHQTTASCICFINGKPAKREYRSFNIELKGQIDDFRSMAEAVRRKYSRALKENQPLPDLILIDGGEGQLKAAIESLNQLELTSIPSLGLAKRFEEIYLPHQPEPVIFSRTSPALRLLQAVRDEAHRFAVFNHQRRRQKVFLQSVLDEIPGIGHSRKQKLLEVFGSVDMIAQSDRQSLIDQGKLPSTTADYVYNFFHSHEFQLVRERYGVSTFSLED